MIHTALACASVCFCLGQSLAGPLILSGNENKIDLTSGAAKVIPNAAPDNLSVLDFASFPPKVTTLAGLPNSVLGPPSNIAITPDGALALVADSVKIDPADPTKTIPNDRIHVLDLSTSPVKVVGEVRAGVQPSGMSITPDGRFALVANRAGGSVTVLKIEGRTVQAGETVVVGKPEDSISDVAIAPDGKTVLATAQKGGYVALLHFSDGQLKFTGQKLNAFGQPYRCVITPDGQLGLTAGQGFGNGRDHDGLTIIDLQANPVRAIEYVELGRVPESIELSPDGRLLAVVLMNGSNVAATDPNYHPQGALEILERRGKTFVRRQTLPIGAIPEGVAFTSDGKYLAVGCHPSKEIWLFEVRRGKVRNTGVRVPVPGLPSSMRATP